MLLLIKHDKGTSVPLCNVNFLWYIWAMWHRVVWWGCEMCAARESMYSSSCIYWAINSNQTELLKQQMSQ